MINLIPPIRALFSLSVLTMRLCLVALVALAHGALATTYFKETFDCE